MPNIPSDREIKPAFRDYWNEQRESALQTLCEAEGMNPQVAAEMVEAYQFTGKEPLRETVFNALETKPKLMERKRIFERVVDKLIGVVQMFDERMGDV